MGDSFVPGLTLDRIDPNKGYYKENCRWLEPAKQARNRTRRRDNKSGITGVRFDSKDNGYCAKCKSTDGTEKTRFFSLAIYGDRALALAIEWREQCLEELNLAGAGYSPYHGKDKACAL